jgi:hypothetical protein
MVSTATSSPMVPEMMMKGRSGSKSRTMSKARRPSNCGRL